MLWIIIVAFLAGVWVGACLLKRFAEKKLAEMKDIQEAVTERIEIYRGRKWRDSWKGTIPERLAKQALSELGFREPLKHSKANAVVELMAEGIAEAYEMGKTKGKMGARDHST